MRALDRHDIAGAIGVGVVTCVVAL